MFVTKKIKYLKIKKINIVINIIFTDTEDANYNRDKGLKLLIQLENFIT